MKKEPILNRVVKVFGRKLASELFNEVGLDYGISFCTKVAYLDMFKFDEWLNEKYNKEGKEMSMKELIEREFGEEKVEDIKSLFFI